MAKALEKATLGGGCFWCLDASYRQIRGVVNVVSGYAGGQVDKPTYEQVARQNTGHAEVIQLEFDSAVIKYSGILDIFWALHDPTSLNRQGADVGPEYRSIILYHNKAQKGIAEQSKAKAAKLWDKPIVTEIVSLERFWPAEAEHQDFFNKNPAAAYCQIVINPKLAKLRQKFQTFLK